MAGVTERFDGSQLGFYERFAAQVAVRGVAERIELQIDFGAMFPLGNRSRTPRRVPTECRSC